MIPLQTIPAFQLEHHLTMKNTKIVWLIESVHHSLRVLPLRAEAILGSGLAEVRGVVRSVARSQATEQNEDNE